MYIEVPYETMKQNYPQCLEKVIGGFQKKKKPFDEKSLTYKVHWIQLVRPYSTEGVGKIIAGTAQPEKPFCERYDNATVENVREYFGSDIRWWIEATHGRLRVIVEPDTQLPFPVEIAQSYAESLQKDIDARNRFLSLSPEQQREETDKLIQELGFSPGESSFILGMPGMS